MKRKTNQTVTTAQRATRRYKNVLVAFVATASLASGGSAAFADGGQGYFSGERIVSSKIISDTVLGDSATRETAVSGNTTTTGGYANADCATSGAAGYGAGEGAGVGGANGGALFGGIVSDGVGFAQGREYGQPDLFYNFYTQGAANRANAQMYVSPVPVPPHVGQTFITYQPFYPHEMLYKHHDRFHNYYDGGRGMNRTHVSYYYPPVRTGLSNFYWNALRIPR